MKIIFRYWQLLLMIGGIGIGIGIILSHYLLPVEKLALLFLLVILGSVLAIFVAIGLIDEKESVRFYNGKEKL